MIVMHGSPLKKYSMKHETAKCTSTNVLMVSPPRMRLEINSNATKTSSISQYPDSALMFMVHASHIYDTAQMGHLHSI